MCQTSKLTLRHSLCLSDGSFLDLFGYLAETPSALPPGVQPASGSSLASFSVAYLSSSIPSASRGVLITRQPLRFNTNELNTILLSWWLGGSLQQEDACQRLFSMPWFSRELLITHQTLCAVASLPGEPGAPSLRSCASDRQPRYSLERESSSILHILSKDKALTRRMQNNTDRAIKFRWKSLQQRLWCEKRLLYVICFSFHPVRLKVKDPTRNSGQPTRSIQEYSNT